MDPTMARRAFGSVRKVGNSVELRYSWRGQRFRTMMPLGATRKDAAKELAKIHATLLYGTHLSPTNTTVVELLAEWQDVHAPEWSRATRAMRALHAAKLGAVLGNVRLQELTLAHVEGARDALRGTLAPKTLNDALASAVAAWRWAQKRKLVGIDNPWSDAKRLVVPRAEKKALNPEQAARLFKTCMAADAINSAARAVAFLLVSPRRYNELAGLEWDDIEGVNEWTSPGVPARTAGFGTPLYTAAVTTSSHYTVKRGWDDKGHVMMTLPNDKHRYMTYPLGEVQLRVLMAQRRCLATLAEQGWTLGHEAWRPAFLEADDRKRRPVNLVFPSSYGLPLSRTTIKDGLDRLCDLAGVPRIAIHEIRHSAVSLLASLGLSAIQVTAHLGWAPGSKVLAETYLHIYGEDQMAVADKLGALLEGVG